MKEIFRFREFPVYKDARLFRKDLKRISKNTFPKNEQYCLLAQLWRALDSIILNIAEGSDRYSDIDFSRFLNNALTSVNEVVACLDCALDSDYMGLSRNTPQVSFPRKRESRTLMKSMLLDCPDKPDNDKKTFCNSAYINKIIHTEYLTKAESIAKQLKAFCSKVRNHNK